MPWNRIDSDSVDSLGRPGRWFEFQNLSPHARITNVRISVPSVSTGFRSFRLIVENLGDFNSLLARIREGNILNGRRLSISNGPLTRDIMISFEEREISRLFPLIFLETRTMDSGVTEIAQQIFGILQITPQMLQDAELIRRDLGLPTAAPLLCHSCSMPGGEIFNPSPFLCGHNHFHMNCLNTLHLRGRFRCPGCQAQPR